MNRKIIVIVLTIIFITGCGGKNIRDENEQLKKQVAACQEREKQLEALVQGKDEQLKKQQDRYDRDIVNIKAKFANEEKNGDIRIRKVKGGISVTVADRLFFANGSAVITPSGKKVLKRVADTIKDMPDKAVRIDGHTDSKPIKKGSELYQVYPTNWELGAARAVNVVRFLTEVCGVDPETISASSYSLYHPIESNDTKNGRAKNRRIEIILLDKEINDAIVPGDN